MFLCSVEPVHCSGLAYRYYSWNSLSSTLMATILKLQNKKLQYKTCIQNKSPQTNFSVFQWNHYPLLHTSSMSLTCMHCLNVSSQHAGHRVLVSSTALIVLVPCVYTTCITAFYFDAAAIASLQFSLFSKGLPNYNYLPSVIMGRPVEDQKILILCICIQYKCYSYLILCFSSEGQRTEIVNLYPEFFSAARSWSVLG